jgi:hypothetical protein
MIILGILFMLSISIFTFLLDVTSENPKELYRYYTTLILTGLLCIIFLIGFLSLSFQYFSP